MFEISHTVTKNLNNADSAALVTTASSFNSEVYLACQTRKINGKSLMGVISLNFKLGDNVQIITHGADEKEAANAVKAKL